MEADTAKPLMRGLKRPGWATVLSHAYHRRRTDRQTAASSFWDQTVDSLAVWNV